MTLINPNLPPRALMGQPTPAVPPQQPQQQNPFGPQPPFAQQPPVNPSELQMWLLLAKLKASGYVQPAIDVGTHLANQTGQYAANNWQALQNNMELGKLRQGWDPFNISDAEQNALIERSRQQNKQFDKIFGVPEGGYGPAPPIIAH